MLGSGGLLPPGKHQVTPDQVREHFVDAFPESKTRERLYRRWMRHRATLHSVLPILSQWVNGSYVTGKQDPSDVDVVTIMDGPTYLALPPALQDMANALLAGKETKAFWQIDSYPVLLFPDGHGEKAAAEAALQEWEHLWSRVKNDDHGVKGFLEVLP